VLRARTGTTSSRQLAGMKAGRQDSHKYTIS